MTRISVLAMSAIFASSLALAATGERPKVLPPTGQDRTQSEITKELHDLGYTRIHDIRHVGEIYTATAWWDGQPYSIRIDQANGRIETQKEARRDYIATHDDMTEAQVASNLEDIGYTNVHSIEKHGDVFRGMASLNGRTVNFRLNTDTGVVTSLEERTEPSIGYAEEMSDEQIVDALADLGYENARVTEREGNIISVKASRDGRPVDLNIDERNGDVTVVN